MAKRSIYFPDDLERRMAEFAEENWSGVCQEAVSARIQTLELRSKTMMSATERACTRLAASKAKYIEQASERGRVDGATWAADKAEYVELKRLAAAAESFDLDDDSAEYAVVAAILGEQRPARDEIEGFRLSLFLVDDQDANSAEYWEGFVEGALDVFEKADV